MGKSVKSLIIISSIVIVLMLTASFATLYEFNNQVEKIISSSTATNTKDFYALIGQMGDFFSGIIGTIFSIITTIFLAASLYLQFDQIKKSKNDVEFGRVLDFALRQTELSLNLVSNFKYTIPKNFIDIHNLIDDKSFQDFQLLGFRDESDFSSSALFLEYNRMIILHNLPQLSNIGRTIYNSLTVLKANLQFTGLTNEQKHEILRVMAVNYSNYFSSFFKSYKFLYQFTASGGHNTEKWHIDLINTVAVNFYKIDREFLVKVEKTKS